jgi:hypothetical protein
MALLKKPCESIRCNVWNLAQDRFVAESRTVKLYAG